jgi:tetratricopeptide (TPR) repeat protein
VVEVAHEALIREWPTLREWLDQNRQGLLLHRQLTEDTNDWIKLGRDPGALYRGVRLQQTLGWVKTNADLISLAEQEFLDASQKVARKEANQTQRLVRARWIQALLAVIVVVGILAVTNAFAPRVMPRGTFNIAVAEFGEMDANGEIHSSETGRLMSGWTVDYLRSELKKEDPNLVLWPNESTFFTRTRLGLVGPDTAEETASDIDADLLLYGYIDTRTDPPQLILNFWIAPQAKYKFEDIQGSTQIGKPIRVVNLNDPGISVQGELERQSTAVAFIAMGLAQEQLGQTEDALAAFLRAEEAAPQSEMVQFFVGRAYLFLSEVQPDRQEELWQEAEDALLQAVAIDDQYARAYIGLGALYMKRSTRLVEAGQASDPQAAQLVGQAIDVYRKVLELKPNAQQYGNPVEEVARLALGNGHRLRGTILYQQGDVDSALHAFEEAIRYLEASRPVFEASVSEHESYRRYLAQTYEYLGTLYQWQGNALEAKQDYDQALASYQKAIEAFNQCISQGENSPDLVIQNDIVEKTCRPTLEEVQQTYKELTGGQ